MRYTLLFALMAVATGQTIEIKSIYQPAPLAGIWKQKVGDDPRWAEADFDDSTWTAVAMPRPSGPGERGITWYRFQVHLPDPLPAEPLFILIGPMFPAYEIFVNGKLIGRYGGPIGDGHGQLYARPSAFPLPRQSKLLAAIRSEDRLLLYGAQSSSSKDSRSWIGTGASITDKTAAWQLNRKERNEPLRMMCVILLAGSAFFITLAVWRRRGFEYLWIGLFLISNTIYRMVQLAPEWLGDPDRLVAGSIANTFALASAITLLLFAWTIFDSMLRWTTWLAILLYSLGVLSLIPPVLIDWFRDHLPFYLQWVVPALICAEGFIYADLARRARNRRENFWPIHVAVGIYVGANVVFYFSQALGAMPVGGESLTPLEIGLRSALVIFLFGMGIILSQRSSGFDREQGRLQQEMAAAAEVQSLLLSGPLTVNAEAAFETVYLPASEVGGDFYHVQTFPDGSQIALLGDVSGKGLKAAMLVSVAIGALRREKSSSPAAILAGLNEGLAGHSGGGFVTCCCVRYSLGGKVTIASAGHPAPYCIGREVEVPPGLPVGVASEMEWGETTIELRSGEQLTIVSDGVVEAANAKGELFGFERTREISGKSAREIADAAKAWGQNDDITVVTVRRRA